MFTENFQRNDLKPARWSTPTFCYGELFCVVLLLRAVIVLGNAVYFPCTFVSFSRRYSFIICACIFPEFVRHIITLYVLYVCRRLTYISKQKSILLYRRTRIVAEVIKQSSSLTY